MFNHQIMVRTCLPVVSTKTVFIHTSQPLHFQSIDLEQKTLLISQDYFGRGEKAP